MENNELRLRWEHPIETDPRPCVSRFGVFVLQVRPTSEETNTSYEWRMVEACFAPRSGTTTTQIEAQRAAEQALADKYGFEAL